VLELQRILNDEGFIVSTEGAGSPGNETTYFGDRTKQALIKYQNFYRAEILTPVNLTSGTGYFGPSTIAFINR
jgi:peptidoglycan hydrolase-like protein with peptidoglycan-binding domain